MNKTAIEWVKNPDGTQGYTWNPITGCLNHINGMCKGGNFPCYAYRLAYGRLRKVYLKNPNLAVLTTDIDDNECSLYDPFYPHFWPERLNEPLYGKGKGIFVCDMSDLFGMGIPESWTASVLDVIRRSPHRFYLLTKQPQNLVKWSPFPDNCWIGATATNQKMYEDALNACCQMKARLTYISLEPLLERVKIWQSIVDSDTNDFNLRGIGKEKLVDWLIIGSQTKPYKPPKIEWVREIVEAAEGIPVFLKDNLKPLMYENNLPQWAYRFDKRKTAELLRQEWPI